MKSIQFPVQITTCMIYDGLMSVANGSMQTSVGIISESDVIETRSDRMNYVDYKSAHSVMAGSLMSSLGHYASLGKKGLDVICGAKDMLGLGGKCAKGTRQSMVPAKNVFMKECKPSGRNKKGGELLTRGELRARMFE
jgi:hypothetical protein